MWLSHITNSDLNSRSTMSSGLCFGATWVFSAVKWGVSRYLLGSLEVWDTSQRYVLLPRKASIRSTY